MINLINPELKKEYRSARMNVVLFTYCVITAVALVMVVILVLFSHWWLANRIALANTQVSVNESRTAPYSQVRADAAAFSANLGKIQSVLTNRSKYSTALLNIAASLPAGANVTNLTFSPTFVTSPLQIQATTATNEAALALKDRLTKSAIYSKVTLDSVNCGGENGNTCAVSITATMNQKVFIPGATE